MNCDAAFDALTDPSRRDSRELQWHLDLCPRCRQMRDVLEPALDLFGEPAELPVFGGPVRGDESGASRPFLTPEMVQLAERTAADLYRDAAPVAQRRRRGANAAAVLTACLLAGVALFGLNAGFGERPDNEAAQRRVAAGCTWQIPLERAEPAEDQNARAVVLSCMTCHLGGTLE